MIKNPGTNLVIYNDDRLYDLIDGTITGTIVLPAGTTKIRGYIFNQTNLVGIQIPNTVTRIGDYAFANMPYLENLNIQDVQNTLTSIGNFAFQNTPKLKVPLYLPNTTTLGMYSLSQSGFTRIRAFGVNNATINWAVFNGFANLEAAEFGEGVTSITQGRTFQNSALCTLCVMPSTLLTLGPIFGYSSISKCVIKALIPPTLNIGEDNGIVYYYVYNSAIETYKITGNWASRTGRIRPMVDTVAELSDIDTTQYTIAIVAGDNTGIENLNNFKLYNYTNGEWIEA